MLNDDGKSLKGDGKTLNEWDHEALNGDAKVSMGDGEVFMAR